MSERPAHDASLDLNPEPAIEAKDDVSASPVIPVSVEVRSKSAFVIMSDGDSFIVPLAGSARADGPEASPTRKDGVRGSSDLGSLACSGPSVPETSAARELAALEGDRLLLRDALTNLFHNASRFRGSDPSIDASLDRAKSAMQRTSVGGNSTLTERAEGTS